MFGKKKTLKTTGAIDLFDMSTKEGRERQVRRDFEFAKTERQSRTEKFVELNNYYNNKPYTHDQAIEIQKKMGLGFVPPSLTDPYIQVESQIDEVVPTFEFKGRDDDLDSRKAKIREQVANFVMYNNKVDDLNLDNERSLNELGNAFWKVSFDGSIKGPGFMGDIVVGNPDPANIFPDPAAYETDDCEWVDYVYRLHRRKARRVFGEIIDTIMNDNEHDVTEIYENNQRSIDDDTLQVVEHWYRDEEGDIACSIQINYTEVKFIPKYWKSTRHSGNQMYPFVKYGKIPVRQSFWDKGEIEAIQDLCDAANREFITAMLNDLMMANDITVVEKDALVEGTEIPNMPGGTAYVKPNKINAIRRLGGLSQNGGIVNMIEFIHGKIQETNGNFDSAQGKEPIRVTTASGIAQLNERASARQNIKKAGRTQGFRRLAELIDWSALEFYNTTRLILIRGSKPGEPDTTVPFNSDMMRVLDAERTDQTQEPIYYYPKVDIEINVGEGIKKSKAFTLAATQELANIKITPANIGIVLSIVELLDLPNKDEIRESMMQAVQMQQQQEQQQQAGGGSGLELEKVLQQLSPEERAAFEQADPATQQQLLQQLGAA